MIFVRIAGILGTIALLSSTLAAPIWAQTAPVGSCLLSGGEWCWPTTPTVFGEPCQCPTTDGLKSGVTQ